MTGLKIFIFRMTKCGKEEKDEEGKCDEQES
jgi:hypothetical protein